MDKREVKQVLARAHRGESISVEDIGHRIDKSDGRLARTGRTPALPDNSGRPRNLAKELKEREKMRAPGAGVVRVPAAFSLGSWHANTAQQVVRRNPRPRHIGALSS